LPLQVAAAPAISGSAKLAVLGVSALSTVAALAYFLVVLLLKA
jgi:hypothetical protein